MQGRYLALSLLLYLSLDVGNPFMPGAVTFVEGSLEVVDAGRPARADLPMPPVAANAGTPREEPTLGRPAPAVAGSRPRTRVVARRVVAAISDPAPASDDH
jgi:hypothetical protein